MMRAADSAVYWFRDRSLVIMASYERERETQTKPRAHYPFLTNVVGFTVCLPPFSDARMGTYLLPSL